MKSKSLHETELGEKFIPKIMTLGIFHTKNSSLGCNMKKVLHLNLKCNLRV